MINLQDQDQLFKLIADYLTDDITCVAIGGTAMMFRGYKNATKDIDLVFSSAAARDTFIRAIDQLGYKRRTIAQVYDETRAHHAGRPLMFTRGDERFDLFVKNVFGCEVPLAQDAAVERRDYIGKQELVIHVLSSEELILLKSVTGREKDDEDIQNIVLAEKNIDWDSIIRTAIAQRQHNEWILIDLEETLQKLKKITFIPSKHFDALYRAQARSAK